MYLYFHFLAKISHGKDTYLWDRSGGGGGQWAPLSRVNAHPDDDDNVDDDVDDDDDD